jgi:hypothetical protein
VAVLAEVADPGVFEKKNLKHPFSEQLLARITAANQPDVRAFTFAPVNIKRIRSRMTRKPTSVWPTNALSL